MLSPNSGDRVVLLPCDREIIELAGITEKEYREFVRHCRFNSKIRPGTPVAIGLDLILLQIGISLVLAAAAYLLTPKPKGRQAANARLETRQVDGQDIVRGSRIAPKAGFDQLQNVVEMGSVIPLVFANREVIKDQTYGGVRVNTNLLWSQVLSLGGDQLLRSVFLLGEGDNRADSMEIDPSQFAFGNNLLGSYDLAQGSNQSRISIYYNKDGGRLVSADYIAGRIAANDPGNAETAGGSDVFQVRGPGATYGPNFCYAYKPSTQTNFGLYGWVGNGVCYKTNPSLRPAWSPSLLPTGRDDRLKIACTNDGQEEVARMKDQYVFPGLSGIVSGGGAVNVGDVIDYTLQSGLSKSDEFIFNVTGPNIVGQSQSRLSSNDANAAVASRHASFDENIVQGELYRIGSALAVCTSRTNKPFGSAADQASQGVNASFEVDVQVRYRATSTQTAAPLSTRRSSALLSERLSPSNLAKSWKSAYAARSGFRYRAKPTCASGSLTTAQSTLRLVSPTTATTSAQTPPSSPRTSGLERSRHRRPGTASSAFVIGWGVAVTRTRSCPSCLAFGATPTRRFTTSSVSRCPASTAGSLSLSQ